MAAVKSRLWVSERLHRLFETGLAELENEAGRKRRVLDFFLVPGKVQAKVQDEVGKLHRVELALPQFSEAQWQIVCRELAGQALFLASFLSSRIPEDVEPVLAQKGVNLLPGGPEDIVLEVDGEPATERNHLNAFVVLDRLLARLDEDPFSIFVLRGKGREELVLEIRRQRSFLERPTQITWSESAAVVEEKAEAEPFNHERFWRSGTAMNKLSYNIRADELPASLLKRLDPLPLGGLEEIVEPLLEEGYALVARRAQAYGLELQDKNGDDNER